jgi:hypothetical protein
MDGILVSIIWGQGALHDQWDVVHFLSLKFRLY